MLLGVMNLEFKKPLPGKNAQIVMAPQHRVAGLLREEIPPGAAQSAVLALLTPENEGRSRSELMEWKVLLIRRNEYPGVHSGQIAFPGGRREDGDSGFWETACRETFEEVGIQREALQHVGPLTSVYVPPSNFLIHPFVALNRSPGIVRPDPREVVDYKNIPLKVFDPSASVLLDVATREGEKKTAPAWQHEGYTIWGATAMILAELYRLIDEEALGRSCRASAGTACL